MFSVVRAMSEFVDYYELLEISPKASPDVIQMAYKALSKRWHPDSYTSNASYSNKEREQKMKLINEAREHLINKELRDEYDILWNKNQATTRNSNHAYNGHPFSDEEQTRKAKAEKGEQEFQARAEQYRKEQSEKEERERKARAEQAYKQSVEKAQAAAAARERQVRAERNRAYNEYIVIKQIEEERKRVARKKRTTIINWILFALALVLVIWFYSVLSGF
jgi:curved DNA-binding protein CbpA